MPRYSLRTLLILSAIGPPLLSMAWWFGLWLYGYRLHPTLAAVLLIGIAASWIVGPMLWYFELVQMVCGPDPSKPIPRRKRSKVRVRFERYYSDSTYLT
jgi:hypothetical protein